nr:FH1/FH2 domain-containing protein 3 isoform X3 [Neodiprion pinetum]
MESGETSRSKLERKRLKKRRSASISSQDSQSEPNSESIHQVASSGSSTSVKSNQSGSKLKLPSTMLKGSIPRVGNPQQRGSPVASAQEGRSNRSFSKSPPNRRKNQSGSATSSSESITSSSSSSSEEEDAEQRSSSRRRRRRAASSPVDKRCRSSVGSSRTSVLASSADELSLTTDRPPRPPASPKSRSEVSGKTEEAKSFLMRALAPVTNLFKMKHPDSGELKAGWPANSTSDVSEASKKTGGHGMSLSKSITQSLSKSLSFTNSEKIEKKRKAHKLTHQVSGEKAWWMDPSSDNVPEGVEKMSVHSDDISQDTTASNVLSDDGNFKLKIWRQDSSDKACWLDANENIPDDLRKESSPNSRGSTKSERRNRIKHQQSGERAWWMNEDPESVPEGVEVILPARRTSPPQNDENSNNFNQKEISKIRHIDSGERAWWMDSSVNVPEGVETIRVDTSISTSDSSESLENVEIGPVPPPEVQLKRSLSRFPIEFPPPPPDEPLGDRASPEGVENPPDPPDSYGGRNSPYDNVKPGVESAMRRSQPRKRPSTLPLFIGNHTNIDDLLGVTAIPQHSPLTSRIHMKECSQESSEESSECEEIDADQVIIHDSTPQIPVIRRRNRDLDRPQPDGYIPLDDTALQLYKDGDYGAYLDLEASITEQQEEFEGFQTNRKNSIVLRTQLSVRVHTIIEKLLNSEGRELRRALFSLKQIFQEDKDLVHEFVQNDGLACLIKVGNEADQNYQNYILRALGQVMLYVDGMNGVMEHGQTVQWLYTLIASRFRLVVKTALKLLLVFVEYVETNSLLLVRAVRSVDTSRGMIPWTNIMKLLKDHDAADTELLIYATSLVNKCLNGIPDQDTYYDQVDCFEEQGIEGIIQRYMSKQGTDLDLLRQFQIYEAVLHHEDGDDRGTPIRQLDDNIRKTLRNRKSLVDSHERRKSRRHSTGTSPLSMSLNARLSPRLNHTLGLSSLNSTLNSALPDDGDESSSSQSSQGLGDVQLNGSYKENKVDVGVTPALRRRRERAERQRSFIREQQEATANMRASIGHSDDQESSLPTNGHRYANGSPYDGNADSPSNKLSRGSSRKDLTPLMNAANKLDSEEKKPWYGKSPDEGVECDEGNHTDDDEERDRRVVLQVKREGTVKDLTQKLAAQNLIPTSPVEDKVSRIGDMSGLISKAKEGLAKSKSKADVLKSPTGDNIPKITEVKKSENELHWEELASKLSRPLALCDLDFTDLNSEDEVDVLSPVSVVNGVPPPPPPMAPSSVPGRAPPPPPPGVRLPPPPLPNTSLPLFGVNLKSQRSSPNGDSAGSPRSAILANKKSKKTVKLFWKEVRDDPIILSRLDKNKMIWDELSPVLVDTQKLEHLFESRAKDLITKEKQQEMNKNKEIIVLDHKRSNAINIGMTKLPPPRSIKTAILKMDATIMNREGIEKLLTMLPTEEERSRIQEAQAANPDLPLGSAEQFLLTLASISELPARLKLWAFKLDFENSEKEIADPLMDLKQGMETLKVNKTFRGILSTLLSIGIFLNGNEVKGFQLEYLAKVPEVKDTVHKHSLLHHLCHMVMEKFPDSTDLYSEIGAVTRASKIDFDEISSNIGKLENECKASWDHLKLIAKHDGSTMMKVKMSDFLSDCAERIIVLGIVHRRIINRFHKFILWLGIPLHRLQDTKPNEFCRIISEFALEFRTTRERVIQQLEKKANHRERNKTRGKMITEVGKFRTKEDREDAELRQVLGCDISNVETIHGTLPWRRQRKEGRTVLGPLLRDESTNGNLTDGDDELLESLVKTATKSPATRTTPRERKRTRHADRKSLKRSRTRENNTTPEGYQP